MRKICITILFAFSIFTISCGVIGGSSGVEVKAADVDKTFEPKTAIAYIDRTLKRPTLSVYLANFDFNPKNRGDLFRPNVRENPENIVVRFEIISDEKAEPKDNFKTGETLLSKGDDSKQRFYSLNVVRVLNDSSETVNMKNYKDSKINITSLTDEEIAGTFDIQFIAVGEDKKTDENAFAKGSFKAKFWKEN